MSEEVEMKPCPFCGVIPETDDGETGGIVECCNDTCDVRPSVFYDHEEDSNGLEIAIIAWNTRTNPAKGGA